MDKAIAVVGGVSALARLIGVSQPAVSAWRRVPPDRVLSVEAASGIPRTLLRPDLYTESALVSAAELDAVSAGRADAYALLAALMWQAPDAALLARLGQLPGDSSDLGTARAALAAAARATSPEQEERAHFRLFTGVGGGELMPYASYYLTGFLHERPLAEIRADLHRMGLVRGDGIAEPEDHIAFLCETMAGLIRAGEGALALDDGHFFARHLQPWARGFFKDLERVTDAPLYAALGQLGRVVIEIEQAAFALPA